MDLQLKALDGKKERIQARKPLLPEALPTFRNEFTYASIALDGSELTYQEMVSLLENGGTIPGKPERDCKEAINTAAAFDYIEVLARSFDRKKLKISDICMINQLLLKDINQEYGGVMIPQYKWQHPVSMMNTSTSPLYLMQLMEEFVNWIHTAQEHPVLVAADAHLKLVTIRPFYEENALTARLLMNLLLLMQGYSFAIIPAEEQDMYDDAVKEYQTKQNPRPFYTMVINAVDRSLDKYLA